MKAARNYIAFLLRIWREDEHHPWRAMLQRPGSGKEQHFNDLVSLVDFIETATDEMILKPATSQQDEKQ